MVYTSFSSSSQYEKVQGSLLLLHPILHGLAHHGCISTLQPLFASPITSERWFYFTCFPQLKKGQLLEVVNLFHCFCFQPSPRHRDMPGTSSFSPTLLLATSSPPRCYLYNKLAAKGFLGNTHAFLLSILQAGLNCPAIA